MPAKVVPIKPPPGRSGGRKAESPAIVKARAAVNAAAAEFEIARQAMADAGEAMNVGAAGPKSCDLGAAFKRATDAYKVAGTVLARAQQALDDIQAVAK
jgi:hypothetical protein